MQIRKLFKFEMAHRVIDSYTTRCHGLHGHSYKVEIFLEGELDKIGMVMDFKLLKEKFNNFIDSFDHSILIWDEDEKLLDLAPDLNDRYIIVPYNTTAENMAHHIMLEGLQLQLPMSKVIVHETATGYAKFTFADLAKDLGSSQASIEVNMKRELLQLDEVEVSNQIKAEFKQE